MACLPASAVVTVERSTSVAGTVAVLDSFPASAVVTVERLTAVCGTETMVTAAAPGPLAVAAPVRDVM